MQAALRTPEIIDLIFQHLRFTDELSVSDSAVAATTIDFLAKWKRQNKDLINAGLACRLWLDPAMANLWWRVNGMMPFIHLLPVEAKVSSYTRRGDVKEWTLSQELDEANLERFDFYAKFVTHIDDFSKKGSIITTPLIHLAEVRPSSVCFPKLRSFRAYFDNSEPWLFFLSPTLRELRILQPVWKDDPSKMKEVSRILNNLSGRSRHLSVLDVPYLPTERALRALGKLEHLTEVRLDDGIVSWSATICDALKTLSRLPKLTTLALCCPREPEYDPDADTMKWAGMSDMGPPVGLDGETEAFQALTNLHVTGIPGYITLTVSYFQARPIEALSLKIGIPDIFELSTQPTAAGLSEEVTHLMRMVRGHFGDTLTSLRVGSDPYGSFHRGEPGPTLSPEFLEPILLLSKLEVLDVDKRVHVEPQLDDRFLERVAQHLGRLKKLGVPGDPIYGRSGEGLTFHGVQKLVKELQDLEDLNISFSGGDSFSAGGEGGGSSRLRVLHVRASPIADKLKMAFNIARTFPNLEELQYTESTTPAMRGSTMDLWKEVKEWLPLITGKFNPSWTDSGAKTGVVGGVVGTVYHTPYGEQPVILSESEYSDSDDGY